MDLDECTCNQCNNHIDWNNPLHLVAIGKAIKFCRQISGITIDALADNLLDRNRQTGSTTALLEIAKGNECTIITHTENYANQVKRLLTTRHNNVTVMSLSSLRWHGMIPQTVLIDRKS